MRIVLIGYGKMGKEIERIAIDRGHQIVSKIDIENPDDLISLTNKSRSFKIAVLLAKEISFQTSGELPAIREKSLNPLAANSSRVSLLFFPAIRFTIL